MIKTVQKNLCELPTANDVEASKSDDLILNRDINTTDEDDDDCVYVSPDETENGKEKEVFHNHTHTFSMSN